MPLFHPPDPAHKVVALERKVAELEALVRRNAKHSHTMRDLTDANLFDAANGQVPVYDEAIGQYRPGSAGGAAYILIEDTAGTPTNNGNSTTALLDSIVESSGSHGFTAGAFPGSWELDTGLYFVTAGVWFAANATGLRQIHLTGTVSVAAIGFPPMHSHPAVTNTDEGTSLNIAAVVRAAPGANEVHVFGRQFSGGSLTMWGRYLSALKIA